MTAFPLISGVAHMAPIKVGINGFGRIGRLVLRAGLQHPDIEFVAINDLYPPESLAYLLKYDSVHGRFNESVEVLPDGIVINNSFISCFSYRNPAEIPWGEMDVDMVIEATGLFKNYDGAAQHLDAGARRVVISAPTTDPEIIPTLVMGVNHGSFDPEHHAIVSNASCTTNCLAPIAKVIHDAFGLEQGLMTTIHATTSTQPSVDGPSKKDLRGGRAAHQNIIPASTGAAKAVTLVLPELKGRLTGMALRVPTPNVSVVDLTFRTTTPTHYDDICAAMKQAAQGPLRGILGYTDEPVVSTDFISDPHSSIFDAGAGLALDDQFFKVMSWYDNEWGYSNRLVDLMVYMAKSEAKSKAVQQEYETATPAV